MSVAQFTIREQQVNALREFLAIGIEESRVAAPAMIDQHVRMCVAQHRLADSHSLEREERQALKRGGHDDNGRGVEREKAIEFRQQPDILNPRDVRQRHQLRAHEYERGRSTSVFVGRKKFEQLVAPFAWIYPAAVEQEWSSRRAVSTHLRRGRTASEKIDAASNRFLSDRPDVERPLEKRLFDLSVIGDRPWPLKHLFIDIEMDRRLVVRGRGEDTALGGNVEAEHRRRVEVREENDRVVRVRVRPKVIDQRGAPRALLLQPRQLIIARMRVVEDPLGVLVEGIDIAGARVRKAPHCDAVDLLGAFRIIVRPRDVFASAGGQHLHVVLAGHPLGDQTAVIFGPAEYLLAVSLDDEGNSHCVKVRSRK